MTNEQAKALTDMTAFMTGLADVLLAIAATLPPEFRGATYSRLVEIWTDLDEEEREGQRGQIVGRFLEFLSDDRDKITEQ
jgi:hypothetical protein